MIERWHLLLLSLGISLLSLQNSCATAIILDNMLNRHKFLKRFCAAVTLLSWSTAPQSALAFSPLTFAPSTAAKSAETSLSQTVVYKPLSLPLADYGVTVPVACWYPFDASESPTIRDDAPTSPAVYKHRISVRRIGQLLAGWEFIPEFVSKDYQLSPRKTNVLDGRSATLPDTSIPVVLLAHGYLGSRFDLSHLAEELSAEGFVCIAAEYPESLAASYDRVPGLDRSSINKALLEAMCRDWKLNPSAYGIIGHSLGCGTVMQTGDETWARVSIAGFPRTRDGATVPGNGLLLASTGDSLSRFGGNIKDSIAASQYQMLSETQALDKVPPRAALVFDGPGSPNHISFLTESVNESMMDFLSPLLPIARAFEIPVLDFDVYQTSRDSLLTAKRVHPIIVQYLKQEMLQRRSARIA
jgi:hypothetical protein